MTRYLFLLLSMTLFLSHHPAWGAETPCPETDVYLRTEQFHGDACTGQLIGIRLALAAKEALQKSGVTGKLKAKYYALNCAVDGIQVAAGTTIGNRSLEVIDKKDNRLELADKDGKHAVEARLTKLAADKSKTSLELKKQMKALPADSERMQQVQKELEAISTWFRTATTAEVVTVRQR
ncbi:MAG: formylmethanofuran dehydrogenase [Geobacter sp.]|nr:formylmethanofuran dehydrogenase [Geobacter sp.]